MDTSVIWHPLSIPNHEIRLLTVAPAIHRDEALSCSLSVVSLDQDPPFAALSYTWGDPTVTKDISLGGRSWQITANLHEALCHLRGNSEALLIFVDALCINQLDLDEKANQIILMSGIYGQAFVVHCWLGLPEENSDLSLAVFTKAKLGLLLKDMPAHCFDVANMQSLLAFFSKPYWRRAWVVQEVALAPRAVFHYGEHQFVKEDVSTPDQLLQSIMSIRILPQVGPVVLDLMWEMLLLIAANLGGFLSVIGTMDLYNGDGAVLMTDSQIPEITCQAASLTHDHIYAILALVDPAIRAKFVPNYRQDVAELFSRFAFEAMRFHNGSLLNFAIGMRDNPLKLPSWTPDFSTKWDPMDGPYVRNRLVPPDYELLEDSYLGVNAHILDSIVSVRMTMPLEKLPPPHQWLSTPEAFQLHQEWRKFFGLGDDADMECTHVGGMTLKNAYWRTMSRERRFDSTMNYAWITENDVSMMEYWYQSSLHEHDVGIAPDDVESCVDDFTVAQQLFYPSRPRNYMSEEVERLPCHLFTTAKGYFGITNRVTVPKINDVVALIANTAVPTILRRGYEDTPHGEPSYTLVSSAYMAGLMSRRIESGDSRYTLEGYDHTTETVHPHIKVATSWDRIWLR